MKEIVKFYKWTWHCDHWCGAAFCLFSAIAASALVAIVIAAMAISFPKLFFSALALAFVAVFVCAVRKYKSEQ